MDQYAANAYATVEPKILAIAPLDMKYGESSKSEDKPKRRGGSGMNKKDLDEDALYRDLKNGMSQTAAVKKYKTNKTRVNNFVKFHPELKIAKMLTESINRLTVYYPLIFPLPVFLQIILLTSAN